MKLLKFFSRTKPTTERDQIPVPIPKKLKVLEPQKCTITLKSGRVINLNLSREGVLYLITRPKLEGWIAVKLPKASNTISINANQIETIE